jgi:hypothetical protein
MNYMCCLLGEPRIPYFFPPVCNDTRYIGDPCTILIKPCDAFKPCQNLGNCTDNSSSPHDYYCTCKPGFSGTNCEHYIRLGRRNTCLHNGRNLSSQSQCSTHCELLINHCNNVTCFNKGICRSLLFDYKCECLFGSSGRHCEHIATSLAIRKYVSKSFAYIAIIAMITAACFVIVLDVLKYIFGIDPVCKERDRIRRRRALRKKRKPKHIFRPHYVNEVSLLPQVQNGGNN